MFLLNDRILIWYVTPLVIKFKKKKILHIESLSEITIKVNKKKTSLILYIRMSLSTSALSVCSCLSRCIISSNKRFVSFKLSHDTLVIVSIRIPTSSRAFKRAIE